MLLHLAAPTTGNLRPHVVMWYTDEVMRSQSLIRSSPKKSKYHSSTYIDPEVGIWEPLLRPRYIPYTYVDPSGSDPQGPKASKSP